MVDTQLFTWESLSTIGSASLLCFLIVSYTKTSIDRIIGMPTDAYALLVSFGILVVSQLAVHSENFWNWRMYILAFFNSFLVAAASAHIQNKAVSPVTAKPNLKKDSSQQIATNTSTDSNIPVSSESTTENTNSN